MNMKNEITIQQIRENPEIRTYIERADISLKAMGYTEHSFQHVGIVSKVAGDILMELGHDEHTVELARIAGWMHDIGNVVNRVDHAQSGAIMAFRILDKMGMPAEDVAAIIAAIGNHDETTAWPVSEVSAALIIADKTDVRRSRVRNRSNTESFDIHDRVNYAVLNNDKALDTKEKTFTQHIKIDTEIANIIDYFEIYMNRMLLSRRAAEFLGLQFKLRVNGSKIC